MGYVAELMPWTSGGFSFSCRDRGGCSSREHRIMPSFKGSSWKQVTEFAGIGIPEHSVDASDVGSNALLATAESFDSHSHKPMAMNISA